MARRHRDVTVRDGTSEKHWYGLAGFLALSSVGYLFGIGYIIEFGISDTNFIPGGMLGGVNMMVGGSGTVLIIEMFKDSAYVRDTRRWSPKWWYYGGVPITVSAIAVGVGWVLGGFVGAALCLNVLGPAMFLSHARYLYDRHRHVGVP